MKGQKMDVAEPIVNEFAAQHGDYRPVAEFGEARGAMINRGGTAIERWMNSTPPVFSEGEQLAIRYCQALWNKIDRKGGTNEIRAYGRYLWIGQSEHEAMGELAKLSDRVPPRYWSVFQDVARFHSSAADAGLCMAGNSRSAVDAARLCTTFVAGVVAMRLGV